MTGGMSSFVAVSRVTDLFKAFGIERPRSRRLFPPWDLPLVLRSMRILPYEPVGDAVIQDVTRKAVFLLALASGKRRSELAALLADGHRLQFARNWSSVPLLPDVLFRGMTQRFAHVSDPWTFPALTPFVGHAEPDRLMCPVRALRWYLDRTRQPPLRGPRSRLFLPFADRATRTTTAMFSAWICRTIWRACVLEPENTDSANARVATHDVRAFAASWSACNHAPMVEVMRAAYWRNATTFVAFYLRDLCQQREDLCSLGPVVAGRQVIRP